MRRPIFWLLFTVAVASPVFLLAYILLVHAEPIGVVETGVRVWLGSTTLLCVWCSVCIRDEPVLVRCAVVWLTVLFLLLTIGVYIGPLSKTI
jgi:hypothetical protein